MSARHEPSTEPAHTDAWRTVASACSAIAEGDFEVRVPPLGDEPELQATRQAINRLVDVVDAYVRESGASLVAASEGRFARTFLVRGMPGALRAGAERINEARTVMEMSAQSAQVERAERTELAEHISDIASQVASASTELSASAGTLSDSARTAVAEADEVAVIVHALEETSAEIQQAVTLIKQVAVQTRLLSLNATIEAARAGEAGRGFAVVAGEVKSLAGEVASSSDDITAQVGRAQTAAADAVAAIARISGVIRDMDAQVAGVAVAAGAETGTGAEGAGLSHLAEKLRAEALHFSHRSR